VSVLDLVLGRRLANREQRSRKIGAFEGVPAMGLDGIASSAYGPEAALTVLIPLGATGAAVFGWVMLPIGALLAVLFASYWQTIRAYPSNGGAYLVTRENFGANVSLLAAAALMIDYVLNVAVGISAGIAALVSAVPKLQAHTLSLCMATLLLITVANLRGTLDAGRLFAAPTYLFVGTFGLVLVKGFADAVLAGGHPHAVVAPPPLRPAAQAVSTWILLRAFASGCTAMTGVEAVSNGMTAFRDPSTRYGHRTLAAIVLILAVLLAGITSLAVCYPIGAMDQTRPGYQSVLSQLAAAAVGRGTLYYLAMGSLLCVLALSANTSFAAFPRLCHTVAADAFLPKSFVLAGHRLVYSVGILYLALTSGLLLFVFDGVTDRLIPLFAIGAFLTFTLSQAGMVVHGRRRADATRSQVWINTAGALITTAALVIIVVAKFTAGAWITVLAIPAVIVLLKRTRAYYDELERRVSDRQPLPLRHIQPPVAIVITEERNKKTDKALRFALSLGPDVIAVHLVHLAGPEAEEHDRRLRARWATEVEEPARSAGLRPPRLAILPAKYRAIHEPILRFARSVEAEYPGREIAVLVPEVTRQHWYQYLLHTTRGSRLRAQLLRRGGSRMFVVSVPWTVKEEPETGAKAVPRSAAPPGPTASAAPTLPE
jgi:amino acid transporter